MPFFKFGTLPLRDSFHQSSTTSFERIRSGVLLAGELIMQSSASRLRSANYNATDTGWILRGDGSSSLLSVLASQILGKNASASLPYYSFSADPDTGMYRGASGTNILAFATGGTDRGAWRDYGLEVANKMIVRGSVLAHDPDTTGSAASATYVSTGIGQGVDRRLVRSTASSRAYKRNIRPLVNPPIVHAQTFNFNPNYVGDDLEGKVLHYGFIAEDVREALGDGSVTFNEDGSVDDYNWKHVIATLEARIAVLEAHL